MAGFTDTFKPVNVSKDRDRLGRTQDLIGEESEEMKGTQLQETQVAQVEPEPIPVEEEPVSVTETKPSWFKPRFDEEGNPLGSDLDTQTMEALPSDMSVPLAEDVTGVTKPDWFKPRFDSQGKPLPPQVSQGIDTVAKGGTTWNFMPKGVEPQSYTADDFYTNDKLSKPILAHMTSRRGADWVKGRSKEEVIDAFVQERRDTSSGNSIAGIADFAYIRNLEDPDKVRNAAEAYSIYENAAGIFSKNSSWSNLGQGLIDFTQGVVLDPVNLVTLGWGKLVTGVGTRVATEAVKREGIKVFGRVLAEQAAKGISKEIATKAAGSAAKATMAKIVKDGSTSAAMSVANKKAAAAIASKNGLARLAQTSALKDIAGTVAIEGVVNVGLETMYQSTLIELGVRDDFDELAIGLAFVGGAVIGGVQATRIVTKGFSGIKMPSLELEIPTTKNVIKELADSLKAYSDKNVPKSGTWAQKVEAGKDVRAPDAEFFVNLIAGRHNSDTGEVYFKGLARITQEKGLVHVKVDRDDLYSDWMANIIKDASQDEVDSLVGVLKDKFGMNFKEFDGITPEAFGNLFARKSSESATSLGAIGRAAQLGSIDISKLDVKTFVDIGLDKGWSAAPAVGKASKLVSDYQGRVVRLLVSHWSTSALNVSGWAGGAAFNTVSDLSQALLHVGHGTMKSVVNSSGAKADLDVGFGLLKAAGNRTRLLLDNRATGEAFEDYLKVRSQFLGDLDNITSGGVEQTTKNLFDGKLSPTELMVGSRADSVIDGLQRMTFVQGQDAFTKSQEFMYQIDKALRTTGIKIEDGSTLRFKGGYNEFMDSVKNPDITKIMRTKEYRELEAGAVNRTLEGIFSKSYKDKSVVGEVAAVIEDARKIPGIGLLVPFGRFFNNTVSFSTSATPLGLVMKGMGKYEDRSFKEVFSKAMVGTALIYTMADRETYLRSLGLGVGQDIGSSGEVYDTKFDYPASFFKYAARILSYRMEGNDVPDEIMSQFDKQFLLGGLTKNLTTTQDDIMDVVKALVKDDSGSAWVETKKVIGGIGGQVVAASTRPFGVVNTITGLMTPETYTTQDRKQGSGKVVNTALRNFDQIALLLTGKEPIQKYSAAQGSVDTQPTALLGARTLNLTYTERLLNNVGIEPYTLDLASSLADKAPEAASKYHHIFFKYIEEASRRQWEENDFPNKPEAFKKQVQASIVSEAKRYAQIALYIDGSKDPDSDTHIRFAIHKKYPAAKIERALRELGIADIGEATKEQLVGIKSIIDGMDTVDYLEGVNSKP